MSLFKKSIVEFGSRLSAAGNTHSVSNSFEKVASFYTKVSYYKTAGMSEAAQVVVSLYR